MIIFFRNIRNFIKVLFTHPLNYKRIPISESLTLRILGNGSSLNDSLIYDSDSNVEYAVVNRHVLADNYCEIRPKYYILTDSHFFQHPEGLAILDQIMKKTKWEMYIFLPITKGTREIAKKTSSCPNIKFVFYNKTRIDQSFFLSNFCYKYQLGMPVPQNVIVAAIMLGIAMNYKTIELYGVEHSWLSSLYVGEDNLVYLRNSHFYDKEPVKPKPQREIQHLDEYPLYQNLLDYARMFQSYWEIKTFLEQSNTNIRVINKTPNSFIDAFERG